MYEKRFPIEGISDLILAEMAKDVLVRGWDEAEILIRLPEGSAEDLGLEETEGQLTVSARQACEAHVPAHLPVAVGGARANLKAEGLDQIEADDVRGNLHLSKVDQAIVAEVYGNLKADAVTSLHVTGSVYGNATLNAIAEANLRDVRGNLKGAALDGLAAGRVSGNLHAKEIDGPLSVERVGSNAALKEITGAVTVEKVGGNFVAKGLTAGAKVDKIGGNLVLNGEIGTGHTYHFKAGGNGLIRLGDEASAHLTLSAQGLIRTSAALQEAQQDGNTLTGTLGDGGAELVVEAGGNILLGATGAGLAAELGDEISRQVEESLRAIDLSAIGEQVSAEMERAMSQLRVKLESVDWERLGRRTQRSMERAMERLQRDIDRLADKAARRQEKLSRMAERAAQRQERMGRVRVGGFAASASRDSGPDVEQERLAILKMLEEGQISPGEAEMLLDALG